MLRRLKFFGIGFLISIVFLSLGPENRLKKVLLENINYFNPEKRVINQLKSHEFIFVLDSAKIHKNQITERYLLKVLKGGWVDHEKSKRDRIPKLYVIDNLVEGKELSVHFHLDESKGRTEIIDFHIDKGISKRSYRFYYQLFGLCCLIMVPSIFFVRRLINRYKNND